MGRLFWDLTAGSGQSGYVTSDTTAVGPDGHILMRLTDNTAMDMTTHKTHILQSFDGSSVFSSGSDCNYDDMDDDNDLDDGIDLDAVDHEDESIEDEELCDMYGVDDPSEIDDLDFSDDWF